eukprot:SAG11_NODE_33238_length_278_cov_0.871508_1_plen_57_part_10
MYAIQCLTRLANCDLASLFRFALNPVLFGVQVWWGDTVREDANKASFWCPGHIDIGG